MQEITFPIDLSWPMIEDYINSPFGLCLNKCEVTSSTSHLSHRALRAQTLVGWALCAYSQRKNSGYFK